MTLQFRRGPSEDVPASAALGEPIYVTDTGILYIGTETGIRRIGPVTAADLEGLDFTPVQSIDDVPGLTAALAGKSDVGHTHDYSELTGTPDIGATALTDLTDFPTGSPNSGEVLKWNGSQWTFAADLTGDAGAGGDATTLDGQAPAYYLNRANQTGTQTASTISDFSAAVAAAAPAAPVDSVAGKTGAVTLTKTDVGLGNVDNTSDAAKPVSTQTQAELDLKADISSLSTVATSGSYSDLTGTPTIPSSFTDLLPVPVDTDASATIVWSVANQQWEISQEGVSQPVPDPATSTVSANPTSLDADGSSTSVITVQLKDSSSVNIPSGGATVTVTATAGSVGSVTDNGDGTYTATYTAGSSAGSATISATVGGQAISDTASITLNAVSSGQFEFRGLFSVAQNPFGSPGSPFDATDILPNASDLFDAPGGVRYDSQIAVEWTNGSAESRYPFFAYRWTGDSSSEPSWTPQFYNPFFNTIPINGIVDMGVQSIDLGSGTHDYRVYRLADVTQDPQSTINYLVD